jgi:predicted transcriptional regulator
VQWYHVDTIILLAMTLRLTEELDAELNTLATAQGTSKNQLIIAALEDYLARQTHEFRAKAAIEATLSQHAGLIDKLSRT